MTDKSQRTTTAGTELQTIQQQIQERGSFCPVQWLIDNGLLPYANYEAWRYGHLTRLEEAIECEGDALLALLQSFEEQAKALELVSEAQPYHDWRPEQAERELAFSRNPALAQALSSRWLRPQDLPQLDLFMDSGTASAENLLIDSLAERHWPEAETAYSALCDIAPNHAHLGGFETLVLYGKHIAANETVSSEGIRDEIAGLEQDIAPLAKDLLAGRARDYLALAWQRLAKSLSENRIDPPLHPSYAWMQIPDWQQVIDSIIATDNYAEQAELVARLGQALYLRGQQEAALLVGARLFELAPELAAREAESNTITPLHRLWQDFTDSDEPHPIGHFPAWLLLRWPGLIHHLTAPYPQPTGQTFETCAILLRCRAEHKDEIAAREKLQAISPGLLRVYLGLG